MYLLAILCPPLAVLICGKPFQALFSIVASLFCYFPGAIWAILVVSNHKAEQRHRELVRVIKRGNEAQLAVDRQRLRLEQGRFEREQLAAPIVSPADAFVMPPPPATLAPVDVFVTPTPPAALPPPRPSQQPPQRPSSAASSNTAAPKAPGRPFTAYIADAHNLATRGWAAVMESYRNLPEWAQPVVWGMAAATPLVGVILLFRLLGH